MAIRSNVQAEGSSSIKDGSITESKIAAGSIVADHLNAGAGVPSGVTSTAAELNEVDDQQSSTQSTVSVGAEAGDAIPVTIQLKDAAGTNMARVCGVVCWLSSSATTGVIATDDGITVTATTGSLIVEVVDDLFFKAVTNASGTLVLSVAGAGDLTGKYLWVEFPNGKFKVSAVVDLAA